MKCARQTWKQIFIILTYANICKHEHEKNMTRLWCKIVLKTSVEQTKKMRGRIHIYTPLGT